MTSEEIIKRYMPIYGKKLHQVYLLAAEKVGRQNSDHPEEYARSHRFACQAISAVACLVYSRERNQDHMTKLAKAYFAQYFKPPNVGESMSWFGTASLDITGRAHSVVLNRERRIFALLIMAELCR